MLDRSQHCWGGGNWLWDMPMGSDERIWHAPCHSQVCAQDPDSWLEAAVCYVCTEFRWHTSEDETHNTLLIRHPVTSS
jgi:hypothetical protein